MDITVVKRSPPLIKLQAGITPPQAFNSNLFDAYFSITVARSFFLPQLPDPNAAINALEHLILLNPKRLRSHAQRLILLHKNNQPHQYMGALLDLFFSLGTEGLPLKQYFLQLADGFIARDEYTFLHEQQSQVIDRQHALVKKAQGCLFLGHTDTTRPLLVRASAGVISQPLIFGAASTPANLAPHDVMTEANQLIDDGQLDLAMDTLEDAVLADAHAIEAIKFLLQLYVLSGAEIRKEIMEEQLKINFGALPAAWVEAQSNTP
ncbi:MAG: hypothetical protein ACP5Q0_07995 [Halothiobacillus sp.]